VRLLLDTHAFLWWRADSDELSAKAREALLDETNEVFVSAAVAWEIVIKRALGPEVGTDSVYTT
jgi:PIN domain nuclease of toxin-antitoxin system